MKINNFRVDFHDISAKKNFADCQVGSLHNELCYFSYPGSVHNLTPNQLGVGLCTEPGYEQ